MIVSKLALVLFAVFCFLQMTYGLLYGLAPEHLLMKIQRLRYLQRQEEQRKKLLEIGEQQLYFDLHQLHEIIDAERREEAGNELGATTGKQTVEVMSSSLLSAIKSAIFRSHPSPSFKYNFVG